MSAQPARTRPKAGNRRVNPDQAREIYVGLGPFRSLRAVADRLSVTPQAIQRHYAREREQWDAECEAADETVRRKLNAETVRTLEERNRDTIRVVDQARLNYLEALQDDDRLVPNGRDLAALLRIEQLIEGEATDRVELREVREIVVRILTEQDNALRVILAAQLENGAGQAVLQMFRERTREIVAASSGVLEAGT